MWQLTMYRHWRTPVRLLVINGILCWNHCSMGCCQVAVYVLCIVTRVGSTLYSTGWERFDQQTLPSRLSIFTTRTSSAVGDTGCTRTDSTGHASVTRSISLTAGADCRLPLIPTYRSLRHLPENIPSTHISSLVSTQVRAQPWLWD